MLSTQVRLIHQLPKYHSDLKTENGVMAKKSRKTEAKRKPRPSHINVGEDRDYSRQATMVKASGMPSQKSKSRKTADAKKSNSGHKYHRSAYLTNSLEPRFLGRQSIQSSTNTSSDRKDKFGRGGRMITEAKTQSLAKKNLEFSQSSPLNKDPTPPVSLEWTEVCLIHRYETIIHSIVTRSESLFPTTVKESV